MSVYRVRNQYCADGEHEKCPHIGVTGYRCECECYEDQSAHVADELRLEPTPQPDGYYYLYKRNYRGGWDLNETSDAGTAAAYRAWGYQDTTEADFDDKWQQNGARWTAKGEAHNA